MFFCGMKIATDQGARERSEGKYLSNVEKACG